MLKNNLIKKKNKSSNKIKNISQSQLTKNYIDSIAKSLVKENEEPKEIDLVFSSGGFNGPIGMGVGMYLKKMEEYKHIKVKRVSGSSIGAFLSLWYIMDPVNCTFDFIESEFINTINHFKKNKNLNMYKLFIRKYVYKVFNSDDMTPIQKRLFITYYDTKKYKKRIISKYKNREHLINCIIQSGYIPYITDGNKKYKNRYIDGVNPYIFEKNNKRDILFVNMLCRAHVLGFMSINTDCVYKRLLIGVNGANEFFTTGNSSICFYTKDITYKNQIEINLIEYIFFIFLFIMDIVASIHLNTNMLFAESIIYNVFYDFFYNFFQGFIEGFLFS
jgi:hypothetical protein